MTDSDSAAASLPADTRGVVIAVDGPSGAGKSSAARGAAVALRLRFLDTGAMYRALTWWLLEHGIDVTDAGAVLKHALGPAIEVSTEPGRPRTLIDGTDVTASIREPRVSHAVSAVAAVPGVRRHLIAAQRQIIAAECAAGGGIVAEGRDIGTVVAPDAEVKVFLTASEQARAERRAAELAGSAAVIRAEQASRDSKDAPQTQVAADAIEIDATDLSLDEVVARIVDLARPVLARSAAAAGTVSAGSGRRDGA